MVSQGIAKKTKEKSMGSGVRQRSLLFECSEFSERLGEEMQVSSIHSETSPGCREVTNAASASLLGGIDPEEHSKGSQQEQSEEEGGVVRASMFGSKLATEAFCKLTDRQQEYLVVYLRTLSPTLTAQELGLRSTKNVGREIKKLAKKLGFSSVSAMKNDAGINAGASGKSSATYRELMQLIEQQGHRCALTGKVLTPQTARLDHKHPVSQGGSHDINNLHWVLETVNTAKGTMSLDQFVGMCIDVARWAQL